MCRKCCLPPRPHPHPYPPPRPHPPPHPYPQPRPHPPPHLFRAHRRLRLPLSAASSISSPTLVHLLLSPCRPAIAPSRCRRPPPSACCSSLPAGCTWRGCGGDSAPLTPARLSPRPAQPHHERRLAATAPSARASCITDRGVLLRDIVSSPP